MKSLAQRYDPTRSQRSGESGRSRSSESRTIKTTRVRAVVAGLTLLAVGAGARPAIEAGVGAFDRSTGKTALDQARKKNHTLEIKRRTESRALATENQRIADQDDDHRARRVEAVGLDNKQFTALIEKAQRLSPEKRSEYGITLTQEGSAQQVGTLSETLTVYVPGSEAVSVTRDTVTEKSSIDNVFYEGDEPALDSEVYGFRVQVGDDSAFVNHTDSGVANAMLGTYDVTQAPYETYVSGEGGYMIGGGELTPAEQADLNDQILNDASTAVWRALGHLEQSMQ